MSETVYLGYTQAQLDAQYDQRTLVGDPKAYFDRWRDEGRRVGEILTPETGVAYGPGDGEVVDIFRSRGTARRLHMHYHGGAWRALSSHDAWFIAPSWVAAGYTFVSVNFGLLPTVSLATQVDQARRALAWGRDNADGLGIDPDQITVSGHSSGAHLAAMAGLVDWGRDKPVVRGVIVASGVYDLEPVQKSARNGYLTLGQAEALALSPARLLPPATPPCWVVWSTNELDEFQRQSQDFASLLERTGAVARHPVDAPNHFDTWDLVTPALIEDVFAGR